MREWKSSPNHAKWIFTAATTTLLLSSSNAFLHQEHFEAIQWNSRKSFACNATMGSGWLQEWEIIALSPSNRTRHSRGQNHPTLLPKAALAGIDPRIVHVQHGWWYPEVEGAEPSLHGVWKSNCNVLTNDDPDICNPISGGWPLRTLLCRIYSDPEQ